MESISNQIYEDIAAGKLKQAAKGLAELGLRGESVLFLQRLNHLEESSIRGSIRLEEVYVQRSDISDGIIRALENLMDKKKPLEKPSMATGQNVSPYSDLQLVTRRTFKILNNIGLALITFTRKWLLYTVPFLIGVLFGIQALTTIDIFETIGIRKFINEIPWKKPLVTPAEPNDSSSISMQISAEETNNSILQKKQSNPIREDLPKKEISPSTEPSDSYRYSHRQAPSEENQLSSPAGFKITPSVFTMGSPLGEMKEEANPHDVELSPFLMAPFETTFEEYDAFCQATMRPLPDDEGWGRHKRPVINVSWYDAVAYCNWLSLQHGRMPVYQVNGKKVSFDFTRNGYRLPTESEWEYVAGYGGQRFGNGADTADPAELNFDCSRSNAKPYSLIGQPRNQPVEVGTIGFPNPLGIYDLSGNVYEWCHDRYTSNAYELAGRQDPTGPNYGSKRVIRGGAFDSGPKYLRHFVRASWTPSSSQDNIGFRIVWRP
ncbi:SUMF1/EgtB/PvdO family nonheme iron enzyme [Pontibacter sp. G13]|uniref:formylglycine-generating enzyme family protein n=1 Tax=Pontibacter sp. G13 TaxID=3074898 RepID=UPI00288AB514|nr:SUMF1/EgtB/PvdO family nonheme iron enzyme [Pontibacter sp. G13]WNJ17555.1 SUMF1/EgtB/PvdO family nonheme iron enzyme [Pontibacter sp. G13]